MAADGHPIESGGHEVSHVALLYFDDCPNWKIADERRADWTPNSISRSNVATSRHPRKPNNMDSRAHPPC
jgi:hypothetical protein